MRRGALPLLGLALALVPAPALAAQGPQGLDARFGSCGVLSPSALRDRDGELVRLARAPDGSIVAAGDVYSGATRDSFVVTRFSPDGQVDTGFGSGGVALVKVRRQGEQNVQLTGLLVQPDGKIVLSGTVERAGGGFGRLRALLVRFGADGKPDASFGSNGVVPEAVTAARSASIEDIALAPDGGIVAAGLRDDGSPGPAGPTPSEPQPAPRFSIMRFQADGTRDSGFASDGVATVDAGLGDSRAQAVELLPDGRILAAGQAGEQFALVRLLPGGQPDPSFGDGGASYESPPASAHVSGLALLADGRIVVTGPATNVNGRDLVALGRYGADGRPDTTFGSGGFAIDRLSHYPNAIAVDAQGRLVVSAFAGSGNGLVRYGAAGGRDTGFGVDGGLGGFVGGNLNHGDVLLEPDGTVLTTTSGLGVSRFAVDEPALAATSGQGRVCSTRVITKSLTQLLRPGKTARYGKLSIALNLRQPGGVRLKVVARRGSKSASLGSAKLSFTGFGKGVATVPVSRAAARLLEGARSGTIVVTAVGTDGGTAFTGSKTLPRR
jgi:uncharacterized delta-60 repeat protein